MLIGHSDTATQHSLTQTLVACGYCRTRDTIMSDKHEPELIATQQLETYQNVSTADAKLAPLIVDVVVGRYDSSSVVSPLVSRCAGSDSENGFGSTPSNNVPTLTGYYSSPSQFPTDEGSSAASIHVARTTREEEVFCADDIATALMVHYSRRNHFPCSPVKPPDYFNSDSISRLIRDNVAGYDGGELNSLSVTSARIRLLIELRNKNVHLLNVCDTVTQDTSIFAHFDASVSSSDCHACKMQPRSKSAEIQIREMPPCKPAEVQIPRTSHFTVKFPMSVTTEFVAFRQVAGASSFYVGTILTKIVYEPVATRLVTDQDTSMPIILHYLGVPIKEATRTLSDDDDDNSIVSNGNTPLVTKLHSRYECSCHRVRGTRSDRLLLFSFIPRDSNPAGIFSKRTHGYSQVLTALKSVFFWRDDTMDY
jgi:hypothetical protein